MTATRAQPPRPRRTADEFLDRERLIAVAADLADTEGWDGLTLSRVAEAVDRHVSSLYSHVDGLDALRLGIAKAAVDELADEVWRAVLGRSGADALGAIAGVEFAWARAHPGRMAAIHDHTTSADDDFRARAHRLAEPIRATLASFGLDATQVAIAHRVFSSSIRGLVALEVPGTDGRRDADVALAETVGLFASALEGGTWPHTRG